MEARKFKNFTTEDFTWKFDGVPYTFKAGQEIYLEDYKAEHFAKHLIDAEMNRLGMVTNMQVKRNELNALCFPTDEVVTPLEAMQINEKAKPKKGKKVEKEFEELED
jgi:hypothetical protein